jgi:hypothetical protein
MRALSNEFANQVAFLESFSARLHSCFRPWRVLFFNSGGLTGIGNVSGDHSMLATLVQITFHLPLRVPEGAEMGLRWCRMKLCSRCRFDSTLHLKVLSINSFKDSSSH